MASEPTERSGRRLKYLTLGIVTIAIALVAGYLLGSGGKPGHAYPTTLNTSTTLATSRYNGAHIILSTADVPPVAAECSAELHWTSAGFNPSPLFCGKEINVQAWNAYIQSGGLSGTDFGANPSEVRFHQVFCLDFSGQTTLSTGGDFVPLITAYYGYSRSLVARIYDALSGNVYANCEVGGTTGSTGSAGNVGNTGATGSTGAAGPTYQQKVRNWLATADGNYYDACYQVWNTALNDGVASGPSGATSGDWAYVANNCTSTFLKATTGDPSLDAVIQGINVAANNWTNDVAIYDGSVPGQTGQGNYSNDFQSMNSSISNSAQIIEALGLQP